MRLIANGPLSTSAVEDGDRIDVGRGVGPGDRDLLDPVGAVPLEGTPRGGLDAVARARDQVVVPRRLARELAEEAAQARDYQGEAQPARRAQVVNANVLVDLEPGDDPDADTGADPDADTGVGPGPDGEPPAD